MDNITCKDRELPYITDESVFEEQKITRKLLGKFNNTKRIKGAFNK